MIALLKKGLPVLICGILLLSGCVSKKPNTLPVKDQADLLPPEGHIFKKNEILQLGVDGEWRRNDAPVFWRGGSIITGPEE